MPARTRPLACCVVPRGVAPLPAARRDRLVRVLKALADPTRLEILRVVAGQAAPLCACDVVERFDLSQPTISHHLKVLSDAGLLVPSRSGVWTHYALDPRGTEALDDLVRLLAPQPKKGTSCEA